MKMSRMASFWLGLAAAALMTGAPSGRAAAQAYPERNIRLIVPFPPGGLNDTVARLLAPHLEKALGKTIIIDNRPAAAGIVGTDAVVRAEPDGYSLLMVASSHTVAPAVNSKLPYNTENDLAAIALVSRNPLLFVVNSKVAAKTVGEFIALAKAEPGKLNYATVGPGSQSHLITELFAQRAGIKMQHVPYRGGNPAVMAMVTGDTQFAVLSPQVSMPQMEAGALRAIAVGSKARDPKFPQVPAMAESGFADFEAIQWVGLLTTRGTPPAIIARLNAEVNAALKNPDLVAKLAQQGMTPAGGTPDEFQKLISTEVKQWTEVAKAANITAE